MFRQYVCIMVAYTRLACDSLQIMQFQFYGNKTGQKPARLIGM
jgi:hypothetical protein